MKLKFKKLLLTAAAISVVTGAVARDFTFASWGGALQKTQREIYVKPFEEKYKMHVAEDVYIGKWAKFQSMMESGNIEWDVANVESFEMQRGCDEGVFAKIDYAKLGIPRGEFLEGAAKDCGIGAYTFAFVVAYNKDTMKTPPTSTADLYDLKKYPGRRGMRKGPRYNMELALLADGVPAAQVYKVLATKEGQQRVFKKLDTIKSQIVWWEAPATVPDLVASNTVVLAMAPHGRIADATKSGRNLGMIFTPGIYAFDYWVMLNKSPYPEQSYDLMKTFANDKLQAKFANTFPYSPTVTKAQAYLDPAMAPNLPSGKNTQGSMLSSTNESNAFWAENSDSLTEIWNNWLAKN